MEQIFPTSAARYDEDAISAPNRSVAAELMSSIQDYFDLMYDCDTSHFDRVFQSTVQLHGYRDGQMVSWSAPVYRDILDKRVSPRSIGAARMDKILMIDLVSDAMAFVKVRVRIAAMTFVDYLTWHRITDRWLITSKGFHLEPQADGLR